MFCVQCGHQAADGVRFCGRCGAALVTAATSATPPAAPQPAPAYTPSPVQPPTQPSYVPNPPPPAPQYQAPQPPMQYPPQATPYPYPYPYPQRAGGAQGFRLSPAVIVALIGLGAAMVSVFMPWVTASIPGYDLSASAWKKGMRFRLGDWLSKDNLDAYAVLGVAGLAAAFTLMSAAGGLFAPVARKIAGSAGGLLIPIAIMEIQFVLSKDGIDMGYGLYLLAGGAVLTAIANMLPR